LIQFDRNEVLPFIALRNAAGVTIPLIVAVVAGAPGYGVVASMGALNVSYSDGNDPYILRARRMLAATFLGAVAIIAGSLSGSHQLTAVAVGTAWSIGAGLLVALHATAANIGLMTLVLVLVYSGQQMSLQQATYSGFSAVAGGLLQIALSVALWPMRPYEPELRLLAAFYRELSQMASSAFPSTAAPPASERATETYSALSRLSRDHTIQGERCLSLLSLAERIRLGILMLERVRTRWSRDPAAGERVAVLEECFRAASQILADIGGLVAGGKARVDMESPATLHRAAERLGRVADRETDQDTLAEDAGHQIEALAGQLRSALELAISSTEAGQIAFERAEAMRPWQLKLQGTIATLRANVTLRSSAFRHAVRLSGSVLAGESAAYVLGGVRSYWLPMTIAIILKPDFTTTFSRGVLRLAGTLAGLILATAFFHLTPPPAAVIGLIFTTVFILRCLGPANYGILSTAVSALIVLLFSLSGQSPGDVVQQRGWSTLWGGVIALSAYAIWPTWEKPYVSDTIANMLEAYRAYFRAVHQTYMQIEGNFEHELDRTRIGARLARSNAEASVDRFSSEPGTSTDAASLVAGMLASSHRLIHAVMALEAGLAQSRPVPARSAFATLAHDIEVTFDSLAGALRGSTLIREMLPDLRGAHRALIQSGNALIERHALVNVEMDRITNSLTTLTDQVMQFTVNLAGRRNAID
jgi:uncharacterized membrane protein YccC